MMGKYLTFVALIVLTVGASLKEVLVLPSGELPDLFSLLAENEHIRQKVICRQYFVEVFEPTLDSLGNGNMSLKEATENVRHAANEYSPTYLLMVKIGDPSPSVRESVSRNLVGHIRWRATVNPSLARQVVKLEAELHQLYASSKKVLIH
jgi:hypothetical protein